MHEALCEVLDSTCSSRKPQTGGKSTCRVKIQVGQRVIRAKTMVVTWRGGGPEGG